MKKAKLIPSILMLVLLLGVVSVGIYAAKPSVNNITGSLTIVPPDALVEISASVGNTQIIDPQRVAYGKTFEIDDAITFNLQGVTELSEVKDIVITLEITNLTNKELGTYFYNGTGTKTTLATADDILYADTLGDKVDVAFSPYRHIGVSDANATTDTITMTIGFNLTKLTDDTETHEFNYTLNIEEYVPNYTDTSTSVTNLEFAKISSSVNGETRTSIPDNAFKDNSKLKAVVFPTCVSSIGIFAFSKCSSLGNIDLVNISTISAFAFTRCTSLKCVDLSNVSTISSKAFEGCFSLEFADISGLSIIVNIFMNCTKLTNITLGSVLNEIEYDAFSNRDSLTTATYPGTIAEFKAITGYNYLSDYVVVKCSDGDFTTKA